MRSSVERRKLQRCLACYMKSIINLSRRLRRKRAGRRNLHAMFVWEKFKTLCWLSNWIQRSIRKNASHPPCAPLAFLSRLKLSFPSLSNATQAIFSQVYKHGCNNLSAPCASNPRRPSEGESPRSWHLPHFTRACMRYVHINLAAVLFSVAPNDDFLLNTLNTFLCYPQ